MNDRYTKYPDHPLHDVPQEILDAARAEVNEAADWRDVDPEIAEPLADAVVIALLPWLDTEPRDKVDTERLYATTDAAVWAEEFAKVCPDVDEGLMIGWFANAIETAKQLADHDQCDRCGLHRQTHPNNGCIGFFQSSSA